MQDNTNWNARDGGKHAGNTQNFTFARGQVATIILRPLAGDESARLQVRQTFNFDQEEPPRHQKSATVEWEVAHKKTP